ncbi:unnamed protein product [Mytilus coruscus]|uniref:Uncharacterized protein n=1 Tax=Mytilus coruscus TaxID=42192 RepID=A0A6J8AXQ1_MYTCO|nr:unnamed protein product [Mytilus coruscus]
MTKYIFTLQAKCCGVGASNILSIRGSKWFEDNYNLTNQHIPVQCCKSQTVLYPYASKTDTDCTHLLRNDSYHTQGCDAAIENQIEMYSIPFMVFTSLIIVAEICLVIQNKQSFIPSRKICNFEQQLIGSNDTKEISCATTSKHSNENVRYTEQTSITEKESSVNKIESFNIENISSVENVSHSMTLQPTVSFGKETNGNQENIRERDQKMNEDNNETKNVNSETEQDVKADSIGKSMEGNENALSEDIEFLKKEKENKEDNKNP